jgi:hypothetical protein
VWPRWAAGLAWALWALTILSLPVIAWLDQLLHQASYPTEKLWITAVNVPALVASVSAATVGAVLASRRPAHPVGWLLLGLGLLVPVAGITYGYVRYGVVARPGSLPAASYLAALSNGPIVFLWLACGSFVLLLTPTGSLPSPRWRWWARVVAATAVLGLVAGAMDPQPLYPEDVTIANPLFVPALRWPLLAARAASMVIYLAAPVVAAASLVVRFRRARGVERQQLCWLAVGAALAAVALLVAVATAVVVGNDAVVAAAVGTCVALLPLATGAAILRYRLYDLNRIISRTLAYGLLTVLLGGGYAAVVLVLGQLLGQDSSLVVAGATLAVAAAFQPARRRVQQAVDRRFNRRRYDAARTIAAFSARLRQQVDLDTLTAELLGVVEQTMQPTQASLWLRAPHEASRAASASVARQRS